MNWVLIGYIFTFGLLIGSFLNVLIYRLPRELDFKWQRSACPQCAGPITWSMNIPLLSYLWLRGRCAHCQGRISWRYPLVELLIGLAAVWQLYPAMGAANLPHGLFFFSIVCVFVTHALIDLEHQILPDGLTLYLAVLFLIHQIPSTPWTHWLLGAALGFGGPYAVTWLFYRWRGQIGLGGGDIKLYCVLGIYLGPIGVLQNMFWSCFAGALIGVILIVARVMKRSEPLPFGPFILLVAFEQIFFPRLFELHNHLLFPFTQ